MKPLVGSNFLGELVQGGEVIMRLRGFTIKRVIILSSLWTSICTCFLLLGCSLYTMKTKDSLPQGVPKGYVIFYHWTKDAKLGTIASEEPDIYSVQDNIENKEVSQVDWAGQGFVMHRVRISKAPGEYDFVLKYGEAFKEIRIIVGNQTVTPVEVKIVATKRLGLIENPVVYGHIKVHIGRSLPAILDASTIGALIDALYDSDWGVRYLASEALRKMGSIINKKGIDRLKQLSQIDPHGAVRRAAKDAVAEILAEKHSDKQ